MSNETILIKNARCVWPQLFTTKVFVDPDTGEKRPGKYGIKLLLDEKEHAREIKAIEAAIAEQIKTKLNGRKVSSDKKCLRHGDDLTKDYYEGFRVLSASSKTRPVVIDRQQKPITEEDGIIYGGCYVNAKIDVWGFHHAKGDSVNSTLIAVQFKADGEPLSGGVVTYEKAVEGFETEDEDF